MDKVSKGKENKNYGMPSSLQKYPYLVAPVG
jgi:hypothetical protein